MSTLPSHPKYRPDIDGLRALAVIPVVLFHIFPESLSGGYVGVDIFFVISGYLITSIILKNVSSGTFSFADFYSRRIRRIFPTLITVLLFTILLGWFALLPNEYSQLGKHIAGSSIFVSNFVLLNESGYFDNTSISKPLLHLWSLAVEEQFYIIWPILLIVTKRYLNPLFIILAAILVTFSLNIYYVSHEQALTFYSPVMRFWEILAGSLLAWFHINKKTINDMGSILDNKYLSRKCIDFLRLRNSSSVIGLSLLLFAILTYDETLPFPGWYAVIPVLGAVILIAAGPNAIINRAILSNKVMVWFGVISYPLYLWHWPLISFSYVMESGYPNNQVKVYILLLSVILAWVSYVVIEGNIRNTKNNFVSVTLLVIVMGLVGVSGFIISATDGADSRQNTEKFSQDDDAQAAKVISVASKKCIAEFPEWEKYTDKGNSCLMQKNIGENQIAIIGDSHARHLFIGMSELHPKAGVVVFPASCAGPFYNVATATNDRDFGKERRNSYKLINEAIIYAADSKTITNVVLAHNPGCSAGDAVDMEDRSNTDKQLVIERGLRRTLDILAKSGKKVTILLDNPSLPFDPEGCVLRPLRLTNDNEVGRCSFDRRLYDENFAHQSYRAIVFRVVKDYENVKVVDLPSRFCTGGKCTLIHNGHLLYRDRSHLTPYGSRYVAPFILN